MARSTWDGSEDPAVQAEPVEAQIPWLIQEHQDRLAFQVTKADIQSIRQPIFTAAVHSALWT
jgi:hypothetical protein